jgi:hypothetical protein
VHLDTIKFLFYPTDAQLNIPRTLKFTLKLILKTFHPDSASKRSSETGMKLGSAECTAENS